MTESAGDALAAALALLAQQHVVTLASHDGNGPWAAPVFYALDGESLVFVSSPRSRHGLALAADPRCAGAVHLPATDWQAIAGVQLAGMVQVLEGQEAARAQALYERRFPFVAGGDVTLAAALQRSRWYRLAIDEVQVVDNRRGLGARQRWTRA